MTEAQALTALAAKHAKDVFVPRCKTGSTYFGTASQLDGWAMIPTWTQFRTIGYEVKVSRSDFLGDQKWRQYLPHCHEFYFVAPKGVASADEMDEGVGLLELTAGGKRLLTRRKAAYRADADPTTVMRYVLMYRARIERVSQNDREALDDRDFWRAWLDEKDADRVLGREVRCRLAQRMRKALDEADRRVRDAEDRARNLERIDQMVRSLGLDPVRADEWRVKHALEWRPAQRLRAAIEKLEDDAKKITEWCEEHADGGKND